MKMLANEPNGGPLVRLWYRANCRWGFVEPKSKWPLGDAGPSSAKRASKGGPQGPATCVWERDVRRSPNGGTPGVNPTRSGKSAAMAETGSGRRRRGSVERLASLLLAGIFIHGGWHAYQEPAGRADKAAKLGLPEPEAMVKMNAVTMMVSGAALALGIKPKLAALALAGALIPT